MIRIKSAIHNNKKIIYSSLGCNSLLQSNVFFTIFFIRKLIQRNKAFIKIYSEPIKL